MKYLSKSRSILIETMTDVNDIKNYKITIKIAMKTFRWQVMICNRHDGCTIVDVMPMKVSSLHEIEGYNYYNTNIINDIMALVPNSNDNNNNNNNNDDNDNKIIVKEIGNILIKSIITKSLIQSSLHKWKDHYTLSFMLSFFSEIDDSTIITINNNPDRNDQSSYTIMIEVPIILNMHSTENSEYLIDIVKDNPILLIIIISVINNEIIMIRNNVNICQTMKCSSRLEMDHIYKEGKVNDFKVADIISNVEEKIFRQWYKRKLFTEELIKIAAALEYDAIDFSYVLVAIRLKYNNAFASCTVEFIFKEPSSIPTVIVQDLLKSFDMTLDTSKVVPSVTPVIMAQDLLRLATKSITSQAFK